MIINHTLDAKSKGEWEGGIENISDQTEARNWTEMLPIDPEDYDDGAGSDVENQHESAVLVRGKPILTDDEVMAKCFESAGGDHFKSLWAGHYPGTLDKVDFKESTVFSSFAQPILSNLAYYANKNPDQMDRVFRRSTLYALNRSRWDLPDQTGLCGKTMIRDAIEKCSTGFSPTSTKAFLESTLGDRLIITTLSQVTMKPLTWLVPGYVPLGKMMLLAGDGGDGKSLTTLDLIACVTRGRPALGLEYQVPSPASALLISCEDDVADTVVPRLAAAGADLDRVHHLEGIRGEDGKLKQFNLKQYELLARELERKPDIRLIVIDPAGAYIGGAGIDDHNDSDLRAVLSPMCDLAANKNVAIVLVKHFSKAPTVKAVNKVLGSVGYVNAVRAGFVAVRDHDDPTRRFFLPIKFNLGEAPKGLSYTIEAVTDPHEQDDIFSRVKHEEGGVFDNLAGQFARIKWLGEVDITADEAVAQAGRNRSGSSSRIELCKVWMKEFLKDYAYPSDEVVEAAKKAGFTYDNVKEARTKLKDDGLKVTNKGKCQGTWWTGFGEPDSWKRRPDISSSALPQAEAQPLAEVPSPTEAPQQTSQVVVPSAPSA